MSEDEAPIRITPHDPADAANAERLERYANWLYKTNPEFRAQVDSIPSTEELLRSMALYGCWPPPNP